MRKSLFALLLLSLLASCQKDGLLDDKGTPREALSRRELNERIERQIRQNGQFNWASMDAHSLWSAGQLSDQVYAIGYQVPGSGDIEARIHEIDIEADDWRQARQAIYDLIVEGERGYDPDFNGRVDELLPFGQPEVLPTVAIKITNPQSIARLRELPQVRYLEPMGYYLDEEGADNSHRSSSGCGVAPDYNLPLADYTSISPNAKRPWNFDLHNIQNAWDNSQGSGLSICIIDTGVSDNQDNLGSQFASGNSGGRFVQKYSTHYSGMWWWSSLDSPNDQCGHGTQMSGLATGPRGSDGNAVGVAYRANLVSVRAVEDVVISSSNEKNGVKDALVLAGNRSDVRIISMSIGTPFYSGTVADGIAYAHNKGKLIFAAAGTSTSVTNWYGVIFPATMSQAVAVTGVKEQFPYQRCNTCHSGSQVEFVVTMQRSNDNNRTSLTLAPYADQPTYVSGSSAATATTAGMAALVWAADLGQTREQVLAKLRNAAALYPNRNSQYGWGMIDAAAAVAAVQ